METELGPGMPLVAMLRDGSPPVQGVGTALAADGTMLAGRFECPPAWDAGHDVILVTSAAGVRRVAAAEIARVRGPVAVFRLSTPWRRFDGRANPRYAAGLKVEVRSMLGQMRQEGTVLDISLGGMAVAVATKPAGRQVEVIASSGPFGATLAAEVLANDAVNEQVILRLRFSDLSSSARSFVRNLVESARLAAEDK